MKPKRENMVNKKGFSSLGVLLLHLKEGCFLKTILLLFTCVRADDVRVYWCSCVCTGVHACGGPQLTE